MLHLLVDDRLEHALAHRADGAGDADVGLPVHLRRASLVAEVEGGGHAQDRADAVALDREARELGLALLSLLHVHRHAERAESERDLHVGAPAALVLDVEALDARHRRGHRGRVVEDVPDGGARRLEGALAGDPQRDSTATRLRLSSGSESSSQTRWYGLQLSYTIGFPRGRSASCNAAQTAWIPAPPPSPMPFVPSEVNGDGLSTLP